MSRKFQVYEIERNPEYEEYLEQRLMEYAFNLLSEQEFTEKTEEFVVEDKLFNLIHEVDNGTKER